MRQSTAILITGLAGLAAAIGVAVIPAGILEWAVASIGFSEIMPAAAPPLGATFRLLLSGAAMMIVMAVTAIILPPAKVRAAKEQGTAPMSFGFSRLTDFARGRRRDEGENELPLVRRADAHPDAPARAPLVVSRDIGEEIARSLPQPSIPLQPVSEAALAEAPVESVMQPAYAHFPDTAESEPLAMPRSPEPMHWEEIKREMSRGPSFVAPSQSAETITNLSIGDLAARLEAGLRRRKLSSGQAAAVPSPVTLAASSDQPLRTVEPDIDEALQAALATLRGITARAG